MSGVDELSLEYEGDVISDAETISRHALESDPDIFLAPGVARHGTTQALKESHDDAAMTATFAIVTRGKEPNRYNRWIQIVESEYGKGLRLDDYQAAPIVLFDHGYSGLPLPVGLSAPQGGPLTVKLAKSKAVATCHFSKLPHAEPIYACVSEGLLRMASIGFLMLKVMLGKAPAQSLPEGVESVNCCRAIDVVESMLTEWSITALGADPGALRQAIDRGRINGVKLPGFLTQAWLPHAAQTRGLVPGASFRRELPSLKVSVEGAEADVLSACQRLESATPPTTPTVAAADVATPTIDLHELTAAVVQGLQSQAPPAESGMEQLTTALQAEVQKACQPLQQSIAGLDQRLTQMTGKL